MKDLAQVHCYYIFMLLYVNNKSGAKIPVCIASLDKGEKMKARQLHALFQAFPSQPVMHISPPTREHPDTFVIGEIDELEREYKDKDGIVNKITERTNFLSNVEILNANYFLLLPDQSFNLESGSDHELEVVMLPSFKEKAKEVLRPFDDEDDEYIHVEDLDNWTPARLVYKAWSYAIQQDTEAASPRRYRPEGQEEQKIATSAEESLKYLQYVLKPLGVHKFPIAEPEIAKSSNKSLDYVRLTKDRFPAAEKLLSESGYNSLAYTRILKQRFVLGEWAIIFRGDDYFMAYVATLETAGISTEAIYEYRNTILGALNKLRGIIGNKLTELSQFLITTGNIPQDKKL